MSNNLTTEDVIKSAMMDEIERCIENGKYDDMLKNKSIAEYKLVKKTLKEYTITKWIARLSFIIGLSLAALEIARSLGVLQSQ